MNQTIRLPAAISLELTSHYTSPELYGIYRTHYYFQQDAGIKNSLPGNKIDLTLSLNDIFHSNRYWGASVSDLITYRYKTIQDTRRVYLTAVYHFGGSMKNNRDRQTDEEKRF